MNIDISSLLVGALLGAFIQEMLGSYLRRPRLSFVGSGGGGSDRLRVNYVVVQNVPGGIGLNFGSTTIFGKRVHNSIQKIIPIERAVARDCRARLVLKKTGEHISTLWWKRTTNGSSNFFQDIELECGESAELMLFASMEESIPGYFAFSPNGTNVTIPIGNEVFNQSEDFQIIVTYSQGRQSLHGNITMTKSFNGKFSYRGPSGGGSF